MLQYDSCEFGLSDRSYGNHSILFDPTSDDDVKWLLQQGECRLASLSFRRYEYAHRVINVQEVAARMIYQTGRTQCVELTMYACILHVQITYVYHLLHCYGVAQ